MIGCIHLLSNVHIENQNYKVEDAETTTRVA